MRTTITLDDELFRSLKLHAARTGRTIGAIVEDALRQAFASRPPEEPVRSLPTYGGSGLLPGADLADSRAIRDLMDADTGVDALR